MDEKNFVKALRETQKVFWHNFANNYLSKSDDEFLLSFGVYLKDGHRNEDDTDKFIKPDCAMAQHKMLRRLKFTLDYEVFCYPGMEKKGYALLGRTSFDKLDFIKNYFAACGLSEFDGNEAGSRYVVTDCADIKSYTKLIKVLTKHKNVAYVIFNNCDSLLTHDWALQAFAQLSKDNQTIVLVSPNDAIVNFKTESRFVFLGEENTLIVVEKEIEKIKDESRRSHLMGFQHGILMCDFNEAPTAMK